MKTILIILLCFWSSFALSNGFNPVFSGELKGRYETGRAPIFDGDLEAKNYYYFFVTDDAAEKMYKSMPVKERRRK